MRFLSATTGWTLLATGCLGAAAAGCDTFTDLRGRVLDEESRPVRGAVVVVRKGPTRVVQRTGPDGRFEFSFTGGWRSPDAVLSACLPGFTSPEERFPDGAQARDLTVTLVQTRAGAAARSVLADTLSCP